MRAKDKLGQWGEDLAARHLTQAGLVVLERNWRCPIGEIDIVARDGDELVVCEVKTRSGLEFGSPLEAVTPAKTQRLGRLALAWMEARDVRAKKIRIDVIGVVRRPPHEPRVEHLRGVG